MDVPQTRSRYLFMAALCVVIQVVPSQFFIDAQSTAIAPETDTDTDSHTDVKSHKDQHQQPWIPI